MDSFDALVRACFVSLHLLKFEIEVESEDDIEDEEKDKFRILCGGLSEGRDFFELVEDKEEVELESVDNSSEYFSGFSSILML